MKRKGKRSSSCYFLFARSFVYDGDLAKGVRLRQGAEGRAQRISSYSWGTGLPTTSSSQRIREISSCSQLVMSSLCSHSTLFISFKKEMLFSYCLSCHPLCLLLYIFHIVPNMVFNCRLYMLLPSTLSVQINPDSLTRIIRLFMIWSSPPSLAQFFTVPCAVGICYCLSVHYLNSFHIFGKFHSIMVEDRTCLTSQISRSLDTHFPCSLAARAQECDPVPASETLNLQRVTQRIK